MKVTMDTLTPLWTGGVETGKMARIHETSLIGSLRWWYEAIMRGLGSDVCNPTSDQSGERCPRDGGDYCRVCQLFGATGLGRKFRLCVGDGEALLNDNAPNIPIPSGRVHTRSSLRAGRWYLMSSSVMGAGIPLRFIPLAKPDPSSSSFLRSILALIDRYAAIGAKVSNGYGVVRLYEDNGQPIQIYTLEKPSRSAKSSRQHTLPDIRDFFFVKLQFQAPMSNPAWWQSIQGINDAWRGQVISDGQTVNVYHQDSRRNKQQRDQARTYLAEDIVKDGLLPLAPAVRNWLRYHYRWKNRLNDRQKRYLFGTLAKGKEHPNAASKINVSHAYRKDNENWEFRIWGWIPCQALDSVSLDRDQFLTDLKRTLQDPGTWQWVFGDNSTLPSLLEWHALDCQQQDGMAYLRKLLGLNEGGAT